MEGAILGMQRVTSEFSWTGALVFRRSIRGEYV
jgi:hypothetical protein